MRWTVKTLILALLSLSLLGLAGAQTTIRYSAGAGAAELEIMRQLAQQYTEENPDVNIEIIPGPDSSDERFSLYLQLFEAQSSELDVLQLDIIWPGQIAQHMLDLNQYPEIQSSTGDFFPAIVEANTVDGKLTSIPWFTDAGVLYYRTDLLEKYGFDGPPETWDELESMSQTIQEGERQNNQDFSAFVWQGNAYEGLTCDALEWIDSSGGGTLISSEEVITINNPAAVEIVAQAAGWVDTISPTGVTGFEEEDARNFYQTGNAAFMRNWPYAYSLMNEDGSPIAGKFEVGPLPHGEGASPTAALGGWNLGVSKYSSNPDIAADVAAFFASEQAQKVRAIQGSYIPTRPALFEDQEVLEARPFYGRLLDVFTNAVARPSAATGQQYNAVSRAFYTAVHNVLTGNEEAEVALELLELDLQDLTGFEAGAPETEASSAQ